MIDVSNLTFTYPGNRKKTIQGLSFAIREGEIFGFLGPSGAGKSTTQKILIGILKGYNGSVKVAGSELSEVKPQYYEKIGVAFEFPNLYSKFTALENLEFFRSLYSGKTVTPEELLSAVGLENDAKTKISSFSKGMKTRLNFCRAFLNDPDIVFLDEPTSGLDPVNARKVTDFILQKKRDGKTVLLTTHNMSIAQDICDRVAFMVDGKIALIDSPRELKIKKGSKTVRVEYRENGQTVASDFGLADIGKNDDFIKLVKEKNIETMHTLEATLEDIFIEVTGRRLT